MMKYVKARKIMMLCVAGIAALTVAACAGKDKDGVNVIITEEKVRGSSICSVLWKKPCRM